ncbi:McrC family protein [Paenibacillus gallinarum]|uniref:McrC family protein n=1 Tax=Paenibacillus gallinarum TaxID=2762232 RepID=A0ABR8T4F1_9BACL|nr:McrC family protein [Paenibacillus gallinarum]MBD7970408.1 McrC family protein [Paenibacillus gallinarum]
MKRKVVELKEHDVISNKIAPGTVYLDNASFTQLENLVLTFDEEDDADAIDFLSLSSKKNVGKIIKAKNYVGVLPLNNGVQLEILPKLHGGTQEDSKKTFLKMLKTLRDFPSKTFNEANINTEKMPIFEIFITLFIKEVQHLVKRGLKSAYYEVEDNLKVFKGKMNFAQQMKQNTVHKERFYMQYDEFGINRPENRLIKKTLEKLAKESESAENKKDLYRLLVHFESIESSSNIKKDFTQVKIDRNSKYYEAPLNWSRIFLSNQSFTTFSGESFAQTLLFPMDRVFEYYVSRNLKKLLKPNEWTISLQDRKHYLFENKFALRPDIVLRNNTKQHTVIIDTKWKLLTNSSSSNYGISQADMYQMYAYAKKYETNDIRLLYPMNNEFNEQQTIRFTSDDGVKVTVFLVDCHRIEDSLKRFIEALNE